MGGRIAFVLAAGLCAALASRHATAQPAPSGGGDGSDIEMEPEPGSAAAEPTPPTDGSAAPTKDPKIAKKWLAAARELVQKGNYFTARGKPDDAKAQYENAATAFGKAIEAGDDLAVNVELAAVEEKLGKLDDAVRHLRPVVAQKGAVRADVAKKAAAKLDDLATKVGMLTLTVTPEGATVALGGNELGKAPFAEPLVLMPGTYTFSFMADGFQPKDAEIKVEAGSEAERAIALDPVPIIVDTPKPSTELKIPEAPPAPPSRVPLYVGAGATVAGVAGVAIFGALAVKQHNIYVAKDTKKLDREDAKANGRTYAHLSDASLGVAVVAAGFTAYWYFFKYKAHPKAPHDDARHPPPVDETTSKVDVLPWVQPNTGGLSVAGWF